jgi:hypothetical protein
MTKEIDPKTVDLLHQNMKCRLFDIVGEYLDDDNYSSVTFFTDLMDALKDWKEYHHKKLEKVNLAMSLITGDTPSPVGDFSLSDRSIIQFNTNYTEEELNAMCDKAASDQEKEKCREYNLREAEYYNQRAKIDIASTKKDWDEFWEHK